MTSFDVIRQLKKIFPHVKMGHMGTLDPMAQGVLPVAFGNATRVLEYIENGNKVYLAEMTLGGSSDTQDAWGNISYNIQPSFDQRKLLEILKDFTGTIQQIPPMYSAVHHQGQRLYELARQGVEVERKPRKIDIYAIDFIEARQDASGYPVICIRVSCSKGTYVRTLCHDIGQRLGSGAFMSGLTRTQSGPFSIKDAADLETIAAGRDQPEIYLKKMDYPLKHLPSYCLSADQDIERIFHGNYVLLDDDMPTGTLRVYDEEGRFLCIARIDHANNATILHPLKVFK